MGAIAVQAKYEKTTDPKRMMTHAVLNEVIRTDWEGVNPFLPARVATSMRYDKGATKAVAWNEGGKETKIDLPLNDGWYVPDGNPFIIPNGKPSKRGDPDALYLVRHQDRSFSGALGRGDFWNDGRRRCVGAVGYWSIASGVALVSGREAAAPLETGTSVPSNVGLQLIRNPTELIVRGTPEQLDAAVRLIQSLKQ